MLHTSTPHPDSFKDNGSGSLDRVEVRSLLKQLNKAVGFGVCEGLVQFKTLTSHGTFCTGGAEYFAK